jgi:hypothetical protein
MAVDSLQKQAAGGGPFGKEIRRPVYRPPLPDRLTCGKNLALGARPFVVPRKAGIQISTKHGFGVLTNIAGVNDIHISATAFASFA